MFVCWLSCINECRWTNTLGHHLWFLLDSLHSSFIGWVLLILGEANIWNLNLVVIKNLVFLSLGIGWLGTWSNNLLLWIKRAVVLRNGLNCTFNSLSCSYVMVLSRRHFSCLNGFSVAKCNNETVLRLELESVIYDKNFFWEVAWKSFFLRYNFSVSTWGKRMSFKYLAMLLGNRKA